tara:strand:- start:386 stop:673 length:288 start_codon:yes stop_codon:yes gene_type:complete
MHQGREGVIEMLEDYWSSKEIDKAKLDMCQCEHSRARHNGIAGHGVCAVINFINHNRACDCEQFTWDRFATIEERKFEEIVKNVAEKIEASRQMR